MAWVAGNTVDIGGIDPSSKRTNGSNLSDLSRLRRARGSGRTCANDLRILTSSFFSYFRSFASVCGGQVLYPLYFRCHFNRNSVSFGAARPALKLLAISKIQRLLADVGNPRINLEKNVPSFCVIKIQRSLYFMPRVPFRVLERLKRLAIYRSIVRVIVQVHFNIFRR